MLYMGALDHFHRVACWRSAIALACCILGSQFKPTVGVLGHNFFFKFCSVSVGFLYNIPIVIIIIIIIIIKNECYSNIIVNRLQDCGHSKKLQGKRK